ncbi:nicotinamidase-related amidase [Streptomyces sp. LBL]|uniref:isochorismatase family cysteine hydrolase n=1 Tax=Streptomyces sp. LBL TaxID=2940562 RepID=UPI002475DF50|nr:isochorismatase family cysteine hydrolase [Streptomyces sp. LBL]MDH6625980.1 nicotinamidase-related amidase [Streptomyces sp. LBL]
MYPRERTALIVIDATNDFIAEDGKAWPGLREVCEEVGTVPNMKRVLEAARAAGIQVLHAPMETQPWDYGPWKHRTPSHDGMFQAQLFQAGTRGAEFHPDFVPADGEVVVTAHKTFDAFHGTDMDVQLRQRDIDHLILCGLTTNTCVDSTGRDAVERGYSVTFASDAVATCTMDMQRATIDLNWPRYAQQIATTDEIVSALENVK